MKKRIINFSGFVCILLSFMPTFSVWGQHDSQRPSNRALAEVTTPHGSIISAEIADTPAKRSQGLMFRTSMPRNHGMLFVFRELDRWTFWMKNTKMSLDIIWLDQEGHVVHIEPRVPICTRTDEGCPRYHTMKEAKFVLELGAGVAKHYNIAIDSQLKIKLPTTTTIP